MIEFQWVPSIHETGRSTVAPERQTESTSTHPWPERETSAPSDSKSAPSLVVI